MPKKSEATSLGHLDICGHRYEVFEGNSSHNDALATAAGYCDSTRQQIFLHEGLSTTAFRDTMMHEIFHAIFADSGLTDYWMAGLKLDRNSDELSAFEETVIRILVPHLLQTLMSMKGLKVNGSQKRSRASRRTRVHGNAKSKSARCQPPRGKGSH